MAIKLPAGFMINFIIALSIGRVHSDCFCGDITRESLLPSLGAITYHQLSHISQAIENTITPFNKLKLKDPYSNVVLNLSKAENISFQKIGQYFRITAIHSLNDLIHFQITMQSFTENKENYYTLLFKELSNEDDNLQMQSHLLSDNFDFPIYQAGYEILVCRFVYTSISALIRKYISFRIEKYLVDYDPQDKTRAIGCKNHPVSFADFLHKDSIAADIQQTIEAHGGSVRQSLVKTPEVMVRFSYTSPIAGEAMNKELDYISLKKDEEDLNCQIKRQSAVLSAMTSKESVKAKGVIAVQNHIFHNLIIKRDKIRNAMRRMAMQSSQVSSQSMSLQNQKNLRFNGPIQEMVNSKSFEDIVYEQRPKKLPIISEDEEESEEDSFFTVFGDLQEDEYEIDDSPAQLIESIEIMSSLIHDNRSSSENANRILVDDANKKFNVKTAADEILESHDLKMGANMKTALEKIFESEQAASSDKFILTEDPFESLAKKLEMNLENIDKQVNDAGSLMFVRESEAEVESKFAETIDVDIKNALQVNTISALNPMVGNRFKLTTENVISNVESHVKNRIIPLTKSSSIVDDLYDKFTPLCDYLSHKKSLFLWESLREAKQTKEVRLKRITKLAKLLKRPKADIINDIKLKVVYDSEIEKEAIEESQNGNYSVKSINFFSKSVALSEKKKQELEDWIINLTEILSKEGSGAPKISRLIIYSDYSIFVQFANLSEKESIKKLRQLLNEETEKEIAVDVQIQDSMELHFLNLDSGRILLRRIAHSLEGQGEMDSRIVQILAKAK